MKSVHNKILQLVLTVTGHMHIGIRCLMLLQTQVCTSLPKNLYRAFAHSLLISLTTSANSYKTEAAGVQKKVYAPATPNWKHIYPQ